MNVTCFGIKRAHHAVLRLGREAFASLGLTAARFDMLLAVHAHPTRRMPQRTIQAILGICRATTSRMLGSLERLGFVRRVRSTRDRRRKLVQLTWRGRWRVVSALKHLVRSGMARLALYTALGSSEQCAWFDEDGCFAVAQELQQLLLGIRRTFGDDAYLDDDYVEAEIGYAE